MPLLSPDRCLLKTQELCKIHPSFVPSQGFIVTKTSWDDGYTLDFYAVKETDSKEGRIEAVSVACCQEESDSWVMRSLCEVAFWVVLFDLKNQVHTVSFVHPEDRKCIDNIEIGLAFNCSVGLAIAQVGNRDKRRKSKLKMANLKEKKNARVIEGLLGLPGF